jgi:hypothetical protein
MVIKIGIDTADNAAAICNIYVKANHLIGEIWSKIWHVNWNWVTACGIWKSWNRSTCCTVITLAKLVRQNTAMGAHRLNKRYGRRCERSIKQMISFVLWSDDIYYRMSYLLIVKDIDSINCIKSRNIVRNGRYSMDLIRSMSTFIVRQNNLNRVCARIRLSDMWMFRC